MKSLHIFKQEVFYQLYHIEPHHTSRISTYDPFPLSTSRPNTILFELYTGNYCFSSAWYRKSLKNLILVFMSLPMSINIPSKTIDNAMISRSILSSNFSAAHFSINHSGSLVYCPINNLSLSGLPVPVIGDRTIQKLVKRLDSPICPSSYFREKIRSVNDDKKFNHGTI